MKNEVWMMVTEDEYELPVIIAFNPQALADKAGTTLNAVTSSANRYEKGRTSYARFHRVAIDNE